MDDNKEINVLKRRRKTRRKKRKKDIKKVGTPEELKKEEITVTSPDTAPKPKKFKYVGKKYKGYFRNFYRTYVITKETDNLVVFKVEGFHKHIYVHKKDLERFFRKNYMKEII